MTDVDVDPLEQPDVKDKTTGETSPPQTKRGWRF